MPPKKKQKMDGGEVSPLVTAPQGGASTTPLSGGHPRNAPEETPEIAEMSLGELCSLVVDCPHSTPVWTEFGFTVLRSHNIRNGRLDLSDRSFTDADHFADRVRRAKPKKDDIVITREAPMGEVCILPEGLECCLGQRMVLLRPDPSKIDSNYLLFSLQSEFVQRQIRWNEGTGSTVSNLRIPVLEALRIPLHSLAEQKAIAHILTSLDDKIENNRRMNETLEAMARALFKDWFVDFGPVRAKMEGREPPGLTAEVAGLFPDSFDESGLPCGWSSESIDEVADFLNGLALQKYPGNGINDLPAIKIAELRAGVTKNTDMVSREIPSQYVVENGDIIFSWSGSLTQKIWTGGRGALNQHLFKVSSTRFQKWFHYYWVEHHLPSFQAIAASKATTMGHIQRHHLTEALVTIIPATLMYAADSVFNPIFNKIVANDLQSKRLSEIRDLLLPKLLSGEIRVHKAGSVWDLNQ